MYNILMADIINSSDKDMKMLNHNLNKAVENFNLKYHKNILSPITITLGDEFQTVIKSLYHSIKLIIELDEYLIINNCQFKLRYSYCYGSIGTEINEKICHGMLGEGLTTARKNLNEKKTNYKFSGLESRDEFMLKNFFIIHDYFLKNWKVKDLDTVGYFLKGITYKEIASIINRDASSVWRRRKSLSIESYIANKNNIMEFVNGNHES